MICNNCEQKLLQRIAGMMGFSYGAMGHICSEEKECKREEFLGRIQAMITRKDQRMMQKFFEEFLEYTRKKTI